MKKLCKILLPYIPATCSLSSATDFLNILKTNNAKGAVASLDAELLFSNVPVNRTLNYIIERVYNDNTTLPLYIHEEVLRGLLQCCRKEAPFTCPHGQKYQQVYGVAMGSSVGVLLANIFMDIEEVFRKISKLDIYCQYINDIFIMTKDNEDTEHLRTCLQKTSGLKFTLGRSTEGKMPFLDIMVI